MTFNEFLDEVARRLPPEEPEPVTPLEAAGWFIAFTEAVDFLDSTKAREVAELIVAGDRIGGPYDTREAVEAWFNDQVAEQPEDFTRRLLPALDAHFGIRSGVPRQS